MNIKEQYPDIDQWLRYGGVLQLQTAPDQKIKLLLGDGGGIPDNGMFTANTPDEAMEKANAVLKEWRIETKRTLDSFISGELKSTDEKIIQVVGWPPERNPYYVKK